MPVRVLVPVAAAVSAGTAAPWPPEDEPEQQEADQEHPEQAEQWEESKPVVTGIDGPAVTACRRHDLRRLAGVVGDQPHNGCDAERHQSPDPRKTLIHVAYLLGSAIHHSQHL